MYLIWGHWVFIAAHGIFLCSFSEQFPPACGILVPQLGIEPTSPALDSGFLTTGPCRKSQVGSI